MLREHILGNRLGLGERIRIYRSTLSGNCCGTAPRSRVLAIGEPGLVCSPRLARQLRRRLLCKNDECDLLRGRGGFFGGACSLLLLNTNFRNRTNGGSRNRTSMYMHYAYAAEGEQLGAVARRRFLKSV